MTLTEAIERLSTLHMLVPSSKDHEALAYAVAMLSVFAEALERTAAVNAE